LLGVVQYFLKNRLQLVVSDQAGAQIVQSVAQLEDLSQRGDLLGHRSRFEIRHRLKPQLDTQSCVVFAKPVVHLERQTRLDLRQDSIKGIFVNLDELAVPQRRQRLFRESG
jgi:hypothetical protein